MTTQCKLSSLQAEEVRALHGAGQLSMRAIGRLYGVSGGTIFRAVNPDERLTGLDKLDADLPGIYRPITDSELHRLKDAIPRDARDLTARLAGDPLPGRSALDRRTQEGLG